MQRYLFSRLKNYILKVSSVWECILTELKVNRSGLDKFQGVILHLNFKDLLIYCLEIFYCFIQTQTSSSCNRAATWDSRCVQNAVICRLRHALLMNSTE